MLPLMLSFWWQMASVLRKKVIPISDALYKVGDGTNYAMEIPFWWKIFLYMNNTKKQI